ncbi:GGDEF domain-containing protein [Qiania dongpingensis]|uniref:GGDEF domain-containing protein n=1 Tax=Qiania dongpingensis TaxID=2763669 RepID=A0A7G9G3F2_9FIRM|nr:GGDEF domain-containing protein [Qiania dongpingensis]QNM05334.1 GGDEF domain-containing protein [Qiania dongpingensis]
MELTQDLLNGLLGCAEALYIVEEVSKTVVYISCFPSRSKTGGPFLGEVCYKAFLGREEPCPFCPSLSENQDDGAPPYTWDYFEPDSGQWLKIKNRLVTSKGIQYRVGNINVISDMMGLGCDAVKEVGMMQRLILERDEMRDQLFYELSHDRLTGLLNRNQYNRDLESVYREPKAYGILYFDLNNLKEANDRFNHSEGDALLRRLADSIRTALCEDRFGYRLGGDEFLIVWAGCSKEELNRCRDDILRELRQRDEGQRLVCSVAVGDAWNGCTKDLEQLVLEADKRMYEEKRRIKGHGTE